MLDITGLTVAYGAVRALDSVDLHVAEGSITAVLGANGAGKTTLLRTLSGLVGPVAGSIRFQDRKITGRAPEDVVRDGIAHVPEGRGVIAELTVEENLRLGGLCRANRTSAREGIARMVALFPPLAARNRRAETLSGGERQMLAIARALMSRPRLLLLDEPWRGRGPPGRVDLVRVEQNAATALSVADRAVVLNLGRKVADDLADRLAADDRVRHAYLGM
jgi:branched-chain amino acid transport system ATP-binding protein